MQIRVLREACCAQDDQMGPLEAVYNLLPGATLYELITTVVESKFLQYSSSHVVLQGEVEGIPVARVFSAYYSNNRQAEFLAERSQPVSVIIGDSTLRFRFVFE